MQKRIWLPLLVAGCLSQSIAAQEPTQAQIDALNKAMSSAFQLKTQGKYLQVLETLQNTYENAPSDQKSTISDFLGLAYTFVGETSKGLEVAFTGEGKTPTTLTSCPSIDEAKPLDALDAIADLAKDRQIVILNEAHHMPLCRAFGLQVARRLRALGYEYFAAETFGADVAEQLKGGYPTQKIGFYTSDPVFGDLVRQSIKLGFNPVAYETENKDHSGTSTDRIIRRETDEAANLVERIFKRNPKAKVLVYCGYDHATEDWKTLDDGREYAWMAARLKKLTGIDPLTIDQTTCAPWPTAALADMSTPEYGYALSKGLISMPTIFQSSDGSYPVFGRYKGRIDLQVFHPEVKMVDGRPDWLSMGGYRTALEVREEWAPTAGQVLLQAFVSSEPEAAVPVDQILLVAGQPTPNLMLPKGKYRLVIQSADGSSRVLTEIEHS